MKSTLLLAAVVAVAVFFTGCAAPAARTPGAMIVQDSLLAMGGMDRWNGVHEITAVALVTTYDERGRAEANTWRQIIHPRQSITASANLPAGQILLVTDVLVRRDEQIEFAFGPPQQITIFDPTPTVLPGG